MKCFALLGRQEFGDLNLQFSFPASLLDQRVGPVRRRGLGLLPAARYERFGNVDAGTPNQCVDCHLSEYNNTTDPDHQLIGISTDCKDCHNANSWLGANFKHTGITNGCVNCHQADYDNTTNPNHLSAGFPTSCESCHSTNTWFGANFNHTFPINSGKHKSLDCSDCHQNPSNYMQFTCISCHEHNQSKMDDKHDEVNGYVWSSPSCYACHPDGKE